jgi:hypothetical protein
MRASFVTASLMSVLVVAASQLPSAREAVAADLYGEDYSEGAPPSDGADYYDDESAPPQAGYDDGGYNRGRYSEAPPPGRYDERYDRVPEPPRGSIKDGYPVPVPPPARYSEPLPRRERYACLDRWQIKQGLRREGWVDLRPVGGDGERVRIRARRVDSGRVFMLRVDRCSGEVVAARPEYLRTFAFRERNDYWPERRWDRHRY